MQASGPLTHACCAQSEKLRRHAGRKAYLLEGADFWALTELVEISRGAFSQLPAWLQAASDKACSLATACLLADTAGT